MIGGPGAVVEEDTAAYDAIVPETTSSIPSWSAVPKLPQALPGGPFGSSGSDVNSARSGFEALSSDMRCGFGQILRSHVGC